MTAIDKKEGTLKIRMDMTTMDLMDKAREYLKLDKSKFIRQSIQKMAESIIAEQEKTRFSVEDWQAFFAMLDNPPAPSGRMKKAAQKFQEIIRKNGV